MTDLQKREIDLMTTSKFIYHYTSLKTSGYEGERECYAIYEYLKETLIDELDRIKNLSFSSLSAEAAGKLFSLCEKHFYTLKMKSLGPAVPLIFMAKLLKARGWSPEGTDPAQVLKVNRDHFMEELKKELKRAEDAVGHAEDNMPTKSLIATLMIMSAWIRTHIDWHKAEIAARGEQMEGEAQDLAEIEQYLSFYYDAAYQGLSQALERNVKAKEILTDFGMADAMERRPLEDLLKFSDRLADLSSSEVNALYRDAQHNYDLSRLDLQMERSSPFRHMNDGERMLLLGTKGKKANLGLDLLAQACRTGKKDEVHGDLGYAIGKIKQELADARKEVEGANVGASLFVALLGFALAALMICSPAVHAFFESPFFTEPNEVIHSIILIVIAVAVLGTGGFFLCVLAVLAFCAVTYFLYEVVGMGVILMFLITIAGLVFGIGGLVSAAKDSKTLKEHKSHSSAAQVKARKGSGDCKRYIALLTDCLRQYQTSLDQRSWGEEKKKARENVDLLLAYYDMALKQVQDLDPDLEEDCPV